MWEDVIVEEVREVRTQYAEKFAFDLWAIYRDLQEQEQKGQRQLVILPARLPQRYRALKAKKNSLTSPGISTIGVGGRGRTSPHFLPIPTPPPPLCG